MTITARLRGEVIAIIEARAGVPPRRIGFWEWLFDGLRELWIREKA